MHLPPFECVRPKSREEAARLLNEHGSPACLAAGGTDLFPRLKYRLARPELVVSLRDLVPGAPRVEDGQLVVDAQTRLAAVLRSPEVRRLAPALAEAALCVGSNQIRHMGTLGGNLCLETRCLYYNQSHQFQFVEPCLKRGGEVCYFAPKGTKCWAVFASDTAPALVALGAAAEVVAPAGRRRLPLEALYTGEPLSPLALGRGEILAAVSIPVVPVRSGQAFRKYSRRGGVEFAGVTVAAAVNLAREGSFCGGARIAVGSAAGGPVRARSAEEALKGRVLSPDVVAEAARTVAAEVRPVAHHGYSASHLRRCLEVAAREALEAAAARTGET